jgi:hypothetical protein
VGRDRSGDPALIHSVSGRLAVAHSRLDSFRLRLPLQMVVAAVIVVLAWPIRTQLARVTVDVSWQLGLHQAAQDGLRFGRDIVFTYGPLGFLVDSAPFIGPTSALAFIATAAIYLALVGLLLHEWLRQCPAWVAVLLTLAFARAISWLGPTEALQVLAFGLGVEVLRRESVAKPWRVAVIAGLLASFAILAKINVGVFVGAMAVVVVVAVSRPRLPGLLILAGATIATTVGLWLIAGQQLSDLLPYVRASEEIITGYSEAMGVRPPGALSVYAAFAIVAAILAAVSFRTATGWPRDRKLALAALVTVLLFASWKFAFVRNHIGPTFATLAFATLILLPLALRRSVAVPVLMAVSFAFLLMIRLPVTYYTDVATSSTEFLRQARDAGLPWRWDAAADRTRQSLRSAFQIPSSILTELDGRTVSIDPSAAAIASAYPIFTWRPEPIFQSYSAYTSALDHLNADVLRSAARPQLILRPFQSRSISGGRTIPFAMDRRNYWFESPEATVERLCRYRELAVSGDYQVLADSGRQCGAETPLATVTAALGERVNVPAAPSPDDIVLVRVHGVDEGVLAHLRSALWRSPDWHVEIDGINYRLVPGTAVDGLVLAVPTAVQGSAPFAFGVPTRTIAIRGSSLGGNGGLTYEFLTRRLPEP